MEEQEILSTLRAHVARSQEATSTRLGASGTAVDPSRIDTLSAEVWNSSKAVGRLNPRNPGLLNRVVQGLKKIMQRCLSWYTRPLQEFHGDVARAIEEHGRAINSFQPTIVALQEAVRTVELATQEQLSPYVQLFRGLSPVVDLGCGRGEFLELLKRSGIDAYGVDSDPVACAAARNKYLTVLQDDLFDHLRQLPERSLGGVFSARVIEYLPSSRRLDLISLCATRLKPGGVMVIETINPESDFPFGRNSRIDPSHLRPVYPEILKSMLDSGGFRDARISILAPCVARVANDTEESSAMTHADDGADMRSIAPGVSGAQAYAAIARRA
ncbi:MAG: class I SAM-dependent methyltransferase [Candidatus Korobacteraceae bacterium]